MTTIAYREGIVAADSAETGEDGVQVNCEKLFRKRVGRRHVVIATAGGTYSGMVFVDWYGSGEPVPSVLSELDLSEDFEVFVFDHGKVYTANHLCRLVEVMEPYTAIGSGRCHAITAMDCGKSAREAVRLASMRDCYTRAPFTHMQVDVRKVKSIQLRSK